MAAGGSAQSRAEKLRAEAAQARARADALEAEAGAWAAGADGERRVAGVLGLLPVGWHVHHDRLLRPGRTLTNLDHVVIGPSGVYLVDTKNWAGGTSVHDGNLWQHTSSSSPKGRELDNVARFAGEMEKTLGLPVVPVIALAGGRSASFPRQRVRGVEIIPADDLVSWLLDQPPAPDGQGVELLSRRVAHTYPPASADTSPGADRDVLTVVDVLGAERTPPARTASPVATSSSPGPPRRPARRRTGRRRGSVVSGLIAVAALWAFSQIGPHVIPALLDARKGASPSASVGTAPPPGPSKPCLSLAGPTIRKLTGAKAAIEKPTASDDVCTWWLSKPRSSSDSADITVEMGRMVEVRFAASGTAGPRTDQQPGEVSAWLPQNTTLPGWKTGARAPQPFIIWLRFSYPDGASDDKARSVEAEAEKRVTRLAEELAKALAARRST
ncbi:nuclease-related domain-containing protein [Terrabacter sp. Root181]|uniref:nuclease-related domain-containing protein n=1 Tax=Terrabacter sp. Root181 TaxID=1736484 RepID=UPI0009EA4511|nr:nuclease-related domain-containing protein [Terrabacter sp. Root181]